MEELEEKLEFLEWFYWNCDFGPAHTDVMYSYMERYEAKGKKVPENYDFRNE